MENKKPQRLYAFKVFIMPLCCTVLSWDLGWHIGTGWPIKCTICVRRLNICKHSQTVWNTFKSLLGISQHNSLPRWSPIPLLAPDRPDPASKWPPEPSDWLMSRQIDSKHSKKKSIYLVVDSAIVVKLFNVQQHNNKKLKAEIEMKAMQKLFTIFIINQVV